MTTSSSTISPPDQADVDTLRELLDLMANFSDNDQRSRYLLSSKWLRDRGDQTGGGSMTPAWTDSRAEASVDTEAGRFTVTRASSPTAGELVFAQPEHDPMFWLTPAQAADLAEVLHDVSGMATSTPGAPFLAEAVRDGLQRRGISRAQITRETGISDYRLRSVLSGDKPMTTAEHRAITAVGSGELS